MRATIRALIVANEYLESEVAELMKAVSRAYARGRFPEAIELFREISLAPDFVEFLTIPAYKLID